MEANTNQKGTMQATNITARLEELRQALRSESISMGELAELQGLANHIEPGDVELLEAAGVPEFEQDYIAVPASPSEQQDPRTNPSGGPLGWVVVRTSDEEIVRGRMFMEREEAQRIADEMNAA
jgi:hypothetical protein